MASSHVSSWLVLLLCTLGDQCLAASISCSSGIKDNNGHCAGIDRCLSKPCPYGSEYRNTTMGRTCHCLKGFNICMVANNCTTGRPYCKDVDECKRGGASICRIGTCVNTIGNFCCAVDVSVGKLIHPTCSSCERECHFNKTIGSDANSTVSEQMCMSTCQIDTLYKNMAAIDERSDQLCKVTSFLDNTESTLMSLVEASSNQREERKSTQIFEIVIRRQINPEEHLAVSTLGNTLEVDPAVFAEMASDGTIPAVGLIVYKNMEAILGKNAEELEDTAEPDRHRAKLSSQILTVVISNRNRTFRTHPITLTFNHSKINKNEANISCVYWNRTASGSLWSTEGCELVSCNRTHTVCRVFHLSSFAVLMALKKLPEVFALKVITYVGLSISLVCLFMALLTFVTCYPLKDTRRIIHMNLCLSLFIADFFFLFGISLTGYRIFCGVIAAVLHYSFLSMFAWMFLEGVQLYLMVEVVFAPRVPFERYIYWIGYGVPALIVAISAAVYCEGYGTPSSCWLTTKRYFVFSFFVPVLIISTVNLIFLCKTLMRLKEQMSNIYTEQTNMKKNRVFTLTAIGQLVILGCTWIVGAFYIHNATIPMMFIFTILNCFQGMFIYIMHCLMYKKVRDAYKRCLSKCLRKTSIWTPIPNPSIQTSLRQNTESTTSGTAH
uniref:adhesion G protein-coupled receptor E5-like n=1 Tax=Pristiophorus japonicus TaxID=55135 RepID=UPI00398F2EE8